jgi:hypothetical protein
MSIRTHSFVLGRCHDRGVADLKDPGLSGLASWCWSRVMGVDGPMAGMWVCRLVTSGLGCLLVITSLYGCSFPSASDQAIDGATKLARKDVQEAARHVGIWSRSSADAHAGFAFARKNLSQRTFVARATLLESRFAGDAESFDLTTTARGEGDNKFGGGHTERTVRICVRLTSQLTVGPPDVEISNLPCPAGLPKRGAGGPVDKIVYWED